MKQNFNYEKRLVNGLVALLLALLGNNVAATAVVGESRPVTPKTTDIPVKKPVDVDQTPTYRSAGTASTLVNGVIEELRVAKGANQYRINGQWFAVANGSTKTLSGSQTLSHHALIKGTKVRFSYSTPNDPKEGHLPVLVLVYVQ